MKGASNNRLNPLTLLLLRAFLQWQVVTGMEAEQIMESLANYIWFLRAPNAAEEPLWICDVINLHFGYI